MKKGLIGNLTNEESDEFSEIGLAVVHMAIQFADDHEFDRDDTLRTLLDMVDHLAKKGSIKYLEKDPEDFEMPQDDFEEDDDQETIIHGHIEIGPEDHEKFERAYMKSLMPLQMFISSLKHNAEDENLQPSNFINSFLLYLMTDLAQHDVDEIIDDIWKEMEGNNEH